MFIFFNSFWSFLTLQQEVKEIQEVFPTEFLPGLRGSVDSLGVGVSMGSDACALCDLAGQCQSPAISPFMEHQHILPVRRRPDEPWELRVREEGTVAWQLACALLLNLKQTETQGSFLPSSPGRVWEGGCLEDTEAGRGHCLACTAASHIPIRKPFPLGNSF
jgi:hypothetical protein